MALLAGGEPKGEAARDGETLDLGGDSCLWHSIGHVEDRSTPKGSLQSDYHSRSIIHQKPTSLQVAHQHNPEKVMKPADWAPWRQSPEAPNGPRGAIHRPAVLGHRAWLRAPLGSEPRHLGTRPSAIFICQSCPSISTFVALSCQVADLYPSTSFTAILHDWYKYLSPNMLASLQTRQRSRSP